MKRIIITLLCVLICFEVGNMMVDLTDKPMVTETKSKKKKNRKYTKVHIKNTGDDLDAFLNDIAYVESKNNHTSISKYNMLGKYQFSWNTAKQFLKSWELDTITIEEFLSRPELQDSVMLANLKHNDKILNRYIKKYAGQTIDGVYITRAGILAGAQFGPGRVMEFFDRRGRFSLTDGNGVHVKSYIKGFSTYKLPKQWPL